MSWTRSDGQPWPMGATLLGDGVNFAVFSAHATAIDLCLFVEGAEHRLAITARTGDVWHLHVAGIGAGAEYGFRADGPHDPGQGHRFNQLKLLIDPYTREINGRIVWHPDMAGAGTQGMFDSASVVPHSIVVKGGFDWGNDQPPRVPMTDTVIYEAHVKALTHLHPAIPTDQRGRYSALGHPEIIKHLQMLGVTTLELLPIQAFIDDRFVMERGLVNHWGYNTIGFFAPEPRYGSLNDLKAAVKALHAGGIEVVLDVVYNHTGESDALGPVLAFRGLDNASYYRLSGGHDLNDAGTGNTLNLCHPSVLRLVMDSLRYWVDEVHIDGFRFDLATVLGRTAQGFDQGAAFFMALAQDPVLARVKLIAEPWDIGPGGYRLGEFPKGFAEWNDRFRDGVRRFWRGDAGAAADLAQRLLGSAERFDFDHRRPQASVNYITSHDGFSLQDLVSYSQKHNLSNKEQNCDGHGENHSDNMGHEGGSDNAALNAARDARKRAMLATLFLSQGTPMLLSGDELGHSQNGNNNAYAQDNETTWIDWSKDGDLVGFVAQLTAMRRTHPVLRQPLFLHAKTRSDGLPDVIWRRADGAVPVAADWQSADFQCLGLELRMAAGGRDAPDALFCVFNAGGPQQLTLPGTAQHWRCILNSAVAHTVPFDVFGTLDLPGQCVLVFAPL